MARKRASAGGYREKIRISIAQALWGGAFLNGIDRSSSWKQNFFHRGVRAQGEPAVGSIYRRLSQPFWPSKRGSRGAVSIGGKQIVAQRHRWCHIAALWR